MMIPYFYKWTFKHAVEKKIKGDWNKLYQDGKQVNFKI